MDVNSVVKNPENSNLTDNGTIENSIGLDKLNIETNQEYA